MEQVLLSVHDPQNGQGIKIDKKQMEDAPSFHRRIGAHSAVGKRYDMPMRFKYHLADGTDKPSRRTGSGLLQE